MNIESRLVMENSKRIINFILIAIFTLLITLNSTPSIAVTKTTMAKAQIAKATAAVIKVEKIVEVDDFNTIIAQKQLDLAIKEVSKLRLLGKTYARNYTALSKRNVNVSKKISDRKLDIINAEAENTKLIAEAEKAVTEAENLINCEYTDVVGNSSDLESAQQSITSALEAIVKLDKTSETYKNLMARVDALNTILVNAMDSRCEPAKKPVIYLYPTIKQNVKVKIDDRVSLNCAYPKYNENGWNIEAYPDGKIVDEKTGREYYCLYWEGTFKHNFDMSYGFVVEGKDTADFLENSLKKLGLTDREANEFIIYWLPQLEKNKYNLIHFATEEYNKQAPLEISPKPDSLIRILMVYKPLNKPITVNQQQLITPDRKGFTVVEWGGMETK